MNIPLMTEDVNNISNQPDRIIGKASELKKIFDKGGSDIKNFINITLIPALEMYFESKLDKTGKVSELTNDGDGISPYATIDELIAEIAKLVDSSPDALNTLNELAAALGNDPNFATTILNHLSSKVDKIYGKGLSSNDYTDDDKNKLASLPTNAELQREFETKVDKTTYERDKVEIEETISSYGHRIGMNEDNIVALEDMINENTDEIRNYINAQTEILETDVEGLKKQMQEESHFIGYISTNAKIKLLEATPNDFVYSAESGTKWIYDEVEGWKDTGLEVPDQLTPASETTPLIDGTASAGSENAYARGDHRHPTDTTRASAQEFNSLKEEYHSDVPWLITNYDNLAMRVREVEISVQEIEENMSSALDELHNYAQALISGGA